ncbi:MAG: OmpA family protein, partial [Nitrospira sp.]|nr:OmpA family protein [Nitrospira sp.]
MTGTNEHGTTTMGLIDLMTSLAIVFILLFAMVSTQATSEAQSPLQANTENVREVLRDHLGQFGLSLDADPHDPLTLIIVVPEKQLNFEFGQSRLSSQADRFLEATMPFYATDLCGPLRKKIDSLTIQGHTDDQGDDIYNLQLSQERSLAVMIKA